MACAASRAASIEQPHRSTSSVARCSSVITRDFRTSSSFIQYTPTRRLRGRKQALAEHGQRLATGVKVGPCPPPTTFRRTPGQSSIALWLACDLHVCTYWAGPELCSAVATLSHDPAPSVRPAMLLSTFHTGQVNSGVWRPLHRHSTSHHTQRSGALGACRADSHHACLRGSLRAHT